MQLLIKLGLIPDPDADKTDDEENQMTREEREEKLKAAGLFIPPGSLDAMNEEMEKIRDDNIDKILMEKANRLSKEEINTLKKLGVPMS